jgi:hypothetical protein
VVIYRPRGHVSLVFQFADTVDIVKQMGKLVVDNNSDFLCVGIDIHTTNLSISYTSSKYHLALVL